MNFLTIIQTMKYSVLTVKEGLVRLLQKMAAKPGVHYINGSETLPAPLEPEEEQVIFVVIIGLLDGRERNGAQQGGVGDDVVQGDGFVGLEVVGGIVVGIDAMGSSRHIGIGGQAIGEQPVGHAFHDDLHLAGGEFVLIISDGLDGHQPLGIDLGVVAGIEQEVDHFIQLVELGAVGHGAEQCLLERLAGLAVDDLGPQGSEGVVEVERVAVVIAVGEHLLILDVAELAQRAVAAALAALAAGGIATARAHHDDGHSDCPRLHPGCSVRFAEVQLLCLRLSSK